MSILLQQLMHIYLFLIAILSLGSLDSSQSQARWSAAIHNLQLVSAQIPSSQVEYAQLKLNRQKGIWALAETPFSGYALQFYPDGTLKSKTGFLRGKKQGLSLEYYPDGHLRQQAQFHQNKLHGYVKNWFGTKGHPLLALRHYHLGKPHGTYQKWYKSGQLFKAMHYDMGKESGMQQAYNENGSIYANYEARNGRTYGLKRAMLCFRVAKETLSFNE